VPITLAPSVRRATVADAPALAELVNAAYAIEAFFVDGERTNAAEIAELVAKGTFVVLEHAHDTGRLGAAVYVERGYFGMLSVHPELQGMGLGTRLVRVAEALCEAFGSREVNLKIINLREELARWYRSLGYREVGVAPYEHRAVKQACHFVEMRKQLAA
jgi:N-acetylglutamate synthase-like GNAT family acetyltransferase